MVLMFFTKSMLMALWSYIIINVKAIVIAISHEEVNSEIFQFNVKLNFLLDVRLTFTPKRIHGKEKTICIGTPNVQSNNG